jgi:hypothetical protein
VGSAVARFVGEFAPRLTTTLPDVESLLTGIIVPRIL